MKSFKYLLITAFIFSTTAIGAMEVSEEKSIESANQNQVNSAGNVLSLLDACIPAAAEKVYIAGSLEKTNQLLATMPRELQEQVKQYITAKHSQYICTSTINTNINTTDRHYSIIFTSDMSKLYTTDNTAIKIFDIVTGNCIYTININEPFTLLYSNSTLVAVQIGYETIKIFDLETGNCLNTININKPFIFLESNGIHVTIRIDDKTIKTFDINTGKCLKGKQGCKQTTTITKYKGCDTGAKNLETCDAKTIADNYYTLKTNNNPMSSQQLPDCHQVAMQTDDKTIKIFDLKTTRCIYTININESFSLFKYLLDGTQIAVLLGNDKKKKNVKIYDLQSFEETINAGIKQRREAFKKELNKIHEEKEQDTPEESSEKEQEEDSYCCVQ